MVTDHDNPDDVSDSSAGEPSAVEPSTSSPSVMALAGAITGALGVVLAALPILVMLWVWLAL
jgi:hypothetical protein